MRDGRGHGEKADGRVVNDWRTGQKDQKEGGGTLSRNRGCTLKERNLAESSEV